MIAAINIKLSIDRTKKAPSSRRTALFITILIVVAGAYLPARAQCLKYEPAVVTLTGTLSSHVFPGPPNYESIKRGDQKETAIILNLRAPICTNGSSDPRFDEPENNVRDLQLVITKPADWQTVDRRLRKRVVVTGTLFHAHTGHHRTKVLIDVASIRSAT
jgi:hypothetical protein